MNQLGRGIMLDADGNEGIRSESLLFHKQKRNSSFFERARLQYTEEPKLIVPSEPIVAKYKVNSPVNRFAQMPPFVGI